MTKNDFNLISPKVAIIGRPSVGKSTLFNILTDSRKSVVKNQAGVTRDIIIEPADVWGKKIDLIDTGGVTRIVRVDRFAYCPFLCHIRKS